MNVEKQIEFETAEMLEIIEKAREEYANDITDHTENEYIREGLLNAGYRKQSEGEWVAHSWQYECSVCKNCIEFQDLMATDYDPIADLDYKYCPYCGAKMKGGAE